jgi:D-alanine-D-alanine ligase
MPNTLQGKKLAFIYNVRHKYPDPKDPKTFNEADFDDPPTIDSMVRHLKNIGFDILSIESDTQAEEKLVKEKGNIGFCLNYSEEVFGSNPKIYMAEVLEKLGIPFSGCSNAVQKLIIDKGKMKEVLLSKQVPTLRFQIIKSVNEKLDSKLRYPVIVKPIARGSSAGITNKSIVYNDKKLSEQVKFILDTFSEPALIEPYIDGREFSVGMLGNPPEIFPIIEPKHESLPKEYYPIDSLEVKWLLEEELGEDFFNCPAKVDVKLKAYIEKVCISAWNALGITDFCRIDLRMNEVGDLFVLDVNSPPGLIPPEISTTSYFPMAAKVKGDDYEALLGKIIETGLQRLSILSV